MKASKDILFSIIKTTQMGQLGIRSVLNTPLDADLRSALRSQKQEYDKIEQEALAIAASRGWEPAEINPAIKGMLNAMTGARLRFGNANSKAAAMTVNGNTRGMIKGYKNIHQYRGEDQTVTELAQRLLDHEKANITQMQEFL